MLTMNHEMVAYGKYYITKTGKSWNVTKTGKDKSVLFSGAYTDCINYCKNLKKHESPYR